MDMNKIFKTLWFTPGNSGLWGLPMFFVGDPGTAKCLGLGTPVMKHDGAIVPVEDVKQGDLLMGPDSRPRRVLSATRGRGPLYKIVPNKGEPWVCNDVHVLTLVNYRSGEIVDMPLDQYLRKGSRFKHEHKLFTPEGGVSFSANAEVLPIDPYFLGVWLGDGTKSLDGVAITKADAEIEMLCRDTAATWGLQLRTEKYENKCPTHHISGDKGRGGNRLLEVLRSVMGDGETIPHRYLTASRTDRAALLAGLVDTDGTIDNSCIAITQKRRGYADGTAFLARSLGLRATINEMPVDDYGMYWRVYISGDATFLPTRIARKMPKVRKQKKNPLRTGFSVESLGEGEYAGFTLDGDHRFLLGDFTVTHNTALIERYALENGLASIVVIASLREPADFFGLPIPGKNEQGITVTTNAAPDWAVQACEVGHCVVFFDELPAAPPAVQAALLRIFHERVVGELQLPPTVRLMAAGNEVEDTAGGYDMNVALANRNGHMRWPGVSVDDWIDWMTTQSGSGTDEVQAMDPAEEEKRVLKAWPDHWAKARGAVSGFIRRRPELLVKKPKTKDPNASKAWPSMRTWEMATRLLAGAALHDLSQADTEDLLAAYIGVGPAGEFSKWKKELDLPDPAAILDGKLPFKHDPKRLDWSIAVLSSCSALVCPQNAAHRKPRAEKLWEILDTVAKDAADLVVPPAKQLIKSRLVMRGAADAVLTRINPVLKAAGIHYAGK